MIKTRRANWYKFGVNGNKTDPASPIMPDTCFCDIENMPWSPFFELDLE